MIEKLMDNSMNHSRFPVDMLLQERTPFYYYDMEVLHQTLEEIKRHTAGMNCVVHYALKANSNFNIINEIAKHGLGADLVSGNEIKAAIEAGFPTHEMAFSGVGKTDWEIKLGLEKGIGCFNVESFPELDIINQLAAEMGKTAPIAIRVNPDIDAHTHKFITTGTAENKFGIGIESLMPVVRHAMELPHIHLRGLHFHIGSQITQMQPYVMLCQTINALQDHYEQQGIRFEMINVGGGLGIDYNDPDTHFIPDFKSYFATFKQHLNVRPNQLIHFELGRTIVGQCGSLITRVVFVKENRNKKFIIVDAGMTDLIRPALYGAYHKIENLTAGQAVPMEVYDVVGPVCESTDVFAHDRELPLTKRGDLLAVRSAGAYGESMASTYNMRPLPASVFH
jgi:diaminopimelate decarboxylase